MIDDDADNLRRRRCNHIRRVAIVDDDPGVQLVLLSILQDMDIDTEIWPGGVPLAELKAFDPQLILLDVELGVSNAFTVLRSLPASYKGVVAIMSGMDRSAIIKATLLGERLGFRMAEPHIKPFSRRDVLGLILAADELLERRSIGEWALSEQEATSPTHILRLRQALDDDLLEMWYQPKFDVKSGVIAGVEALIRARSTNNEVILPSSLFRNASKEDFLEMTDYVVTKVVTHGDVLSSLGFHKPISLNISIGYLTYGSSFQLLRDLGRSPRCTPLVFEIKERDALSDVVDLRLVVDQLKLYSVELSIDDFGMACSSLARLRDIPFFGAETRS